jgi:hypothetical protein
MIWQDYWLTRFSKRRPSSTSSKNGLEDCLIQTIEFTCFLETQSVNQGESRAKPLQQTLWYLLKQKLKL